METRAECQTFAGCLAKTLNHTTLSLFLEQQEQTLLLYYLSLDQKGSLYCKEF